MTLDKLSQLYYLNKEIKLEEKRLEELKSAAIDTSAKITGLPYVGKISDKTAIAGDIAESKNIIENRIEKSVKEYTNINSFIAEIDDCLMRQILRHRFIDGFSWQKVAMSVGGNNTEGSVKMIFYRYLRNS